MTIKIQGKERKFYEFHFSSCMFEPILNQSSWVSNFGSYIAGKPMKINFWCCYWLTSLSCRSNVMTIKIQGGERKLFEFYISSCMFEPIFKESSWVCTFESYIVGKPMNSGFWCCYWLASLSCRSHIST